MFTLVKRQKAYIQIAEQITESLRRGDFKNGDRLPSVRELEARFGVSRSTVREALSALELAGIVEIRPGQGAFVRASDQAEGARFELDHGQSPTEVLEARLIIEPEGARLAAERATTEDMQALADVLQILRAVVAEGKPAVASDIQFHVAVAKASGNSLIHEVIRGVADYLGEALWHSLREQAWAEGDLGPIYVQQHARTLKAIQARNGDEAAQSMREHLLHVQQDLYPEG